MAQVIRFPSHPAEPVEVLELDGPEDLSALFYDQVDAIHGRGWTVYLWADPPRLDAYTPEDRNAGGRADWETFLRGPVVLVCRPKLTADPLPVEFVPYLEDPAGLGPALISDA